MIAKRWMIAILLLFALPIQAQKQYPLRQYLNIRAASAPNISPDGKHVAFLSAVTGTLQVWKVPASGGWAEQMTFFGSGVASTLWSPVNNEMLVVADTDGNEQFQFFLVAGEGKSIVPLTDNPKVRHGFGGWSKDGKQIYYSCNKRNPRYFDCYVMDIETRQARLVFQKDAILDANALSSDGKTLIASSATSNVNHDLYVVDTTTGQGRLLTPHTGDALYTIIGFTDEDKSLLAVTDQDRDFQNLAKIDVATGKITFLLDESHDLLGGELSHDGKTLALLTNRDGYGELSLLDTATLRSKRLPKLPKGSIGLGGFTTDGKTLALGINTPTKNTDAWVLDLRSNKLKQVTFSSLAGIDADTFVAPSLIKTKSFDGQEISGFLYLPKNAPQDHSLPMIMVVHGGPEGQERPLFTSLYQYFVSRGFAVLAPNIRGSSGYGKRYLALDNASKRWDALKDIEVFAKWAGTQPAINPKKLAIFGGSYGGFAVLAMLVHYPDTFSAGVDMFGIADFKTFLANTAPFRRPLRIAEYGDPVKDSEFLDAISPARHADNIKAPLMVIQGLNDPRVPESESALIVKKVKDKGGVVEYLLFPDEGHGIAKLPNRIKAYEGVVAFLTRYLK